MKGISFYVLLIVQASLTKVFAQDGPSLPPLPYYLRESYDETGRPLPKGVPKVVDTNGTTLSVPLHFTTIAYQNAALDLILQEANAIAKEMNLPEDLPITKTNLSEFHISPFGFAYGNRKIGFVASQRYIYYFSRDDKFSSFGIENYDQTCLKLQKLGRLPLSKLDTNAPYQLATQWLSSANMDVNSLNRDCKLRVDVSEFWSGLKRGEKPKRQFVPIYTVSWISVQGPAMAYVELYLPTKQLLQMSIEDPKYILRKPVAFTNLADLFHGNAPIHTNYPVKPIYISAPPP